MNLINKEIKAVNGIKIPQVGFGVYKLNKGEDFETAVGEAIKIGYRHFDTAKIYGNEKDLGLAIEKSQIPREEFLLLRRFGIRIMAMKLLRKLLNKLVKSWT